MAIMGLGVENVDACDRNNAFHKGCLTPGDVTPGDEGCLTPGDAGDKEGCLIQLE